jgi:trimethylamine:corrinoid methyltransferase-like protein
VAFSHDWPGMHIQQAVLSDMIDAVKMCGVLEEISCIMAPLICSHVKASEMELYQFKTGVEHCNKPMVLSISDKKTLEKIIHLASVLAGGEKQLAEKPHPYN